MERKLIVFKCDIGDFEVMKLISQGAEAIVHLAANTGVAPSVDDPIYDCKSNVLGTLNLLECARIGGIDRFVFASSGAPIGEQELPIRKKAFQNPLHPMGLLSLPVRAIALLITKHLELILWHCALAMFMATGSNNKDSAVAKFIKLALDKQRIEIFGDGTQTRDFIYIEDLVKRS